MRKRTQFAVSALISVSAVSLPVSGANTKKSVAMVAPMVPVAAVPPAVSSRSYPVSRARIRQMASGAYPANRLQRGLYLKQNGRTDDALIEFLKAAQENPTLVRAYYERAVIFKEKGYTKLAQSSLQQALKIRPDYKDARVLLASLYLENGSLTDAASELFKSLGLNSSGPAPRLPTAKSAAAKPSVMQTPHGHLFSPLNAMTGRQPAAAGTAPVAPPGNRSLAPGTTNAASTVTGVTPVVVPPGELNPLLKGIQGIDPQAGLPETASVPAAPPVATPPQLPVTPGAVPPGPSAAAGSRVPNATDEAIKRQVNALVNQVKDNSEHRGGFHFPNLLGMFKSDTAASPPQAGVAGPVNLAATMAAAAQANAGGGQAGLSAESQNAQVEMMMKAAQRDRKKHRVAGWVDSIKDDDRISRARQGRQELDLGALNRKQRKQKGIFNPVEMLAREDRGLPASAPTGSAVKITETLPEGIGPAGGQANAQQSSGQKTPATYNGQEDKLPPTGVRVETITTPVNGAGMTLPAGQGYSPADNGGEKPNGSWFPSLDFSHFFRRAISWMPALPLFKPVSTPEGILPGHAPNLTESGYKMEAPSPVVAGVPSTGSEAAPWLPPEARTASGLNGAGLPYSAPQKPAPLSAGAQQLVDRQPAAAPQSKFDEFLAALPKDWAAALQQVVMPKPVEVAASAVASPELQNVNIERPDPARVPAPSPTLTQGALDDVVTARVGPGAVAETESHVAASAVAPVRPTLPAAAAPAPQAVQPGALDWQYAPPAAPQLQSPDVSGAIAAAPQPTMRSAAYSAPAAPATGAASNVSPTVLPTPALPVPQQPNAAALMQTARTTGTAQSFTPTAMAPVSRGAALAYAPQPVAVASSSYAAPSLVATAPPPLSSNINPGARPVARKLAAQGFKFVTPGLSANQQSFVNDMHKVQARPAMRSMTPVKAPVPPAEPPEDKWSKRMKYLLANGTGQLNNGEAFMFSEETGEGVLFLSDGNTIRRKIATPRDAQEVALARRPDILAPKGELQYNLSLLGKILKPDSPQAPKPVAAATTATPKAGAPAQEQPPFAVDDLLGRSQNFIGWLKGVFKM